MTSSNKEKGTRSQSQRILIKKLKAHLDEALKLCDDKDKRIYELEMERGNFEMELHQLQEKYHDKMDKVIQSSDKLMALNEKVDQWQRDRAHEAATEQKDKDDKGKDKQTLEGPAQ